MATSESIVHQNGAFDATGPIRFLNKKIILDILGLIHNPKVRQVSTDFKKLYDTAHGIDSDSIKEFVTVVAAFIPDFSFEEGLGKHSIAIITAYTQRECRCCSDTDVRYRFFDPDRCLYSQLVCLLNDYSGNTDVSSVVVHRGDTEEEVKALITPEMDEDLED